MLNYIKNEEGATFAVAIMLLFLTTIFITYYVISFEAQIKTYNSLEFANVRATINLLEEIGGK
ncbi:hypothetical protein U5N28_13225 [Lysinibacillus telephonicus]|uniref:Uncharacterized protein n=1 Tax=Lysinibacillus telephonicus TaxID=1714840 RepID=A0A431UJC6_9BACI|nr:hypothetical protein [Lysinibacillus telephonicus]RTQ89533.1 hypothetical protein EKG35_16360 [Lysinibacillus telephonicus]